MCQGIEDMCSQVWMFGHAATFQEVRAEQYPVGCLSITLKGKRDVFAVSFASMPQSCRSPSLAPARFCSATVCAVLKHHAAR